MKSTSLRGQPAGSKYQMTIDPVDVRYLLVKESQRDRDKVIVVENMATLNNNFSVVSHVSRCYECNIVDKMCKN